MSQPMTETERQEYTPIYIDRRTGEQKEAGYTVHLYDWEVISNQIELSTSQTVVQFKLKRKDGAE